MKNFKLKQARSEIKANPAQVGKAVYDILSKPQERQEVGETVEAMTARYYRELFDTITENKGKYESPFYIVVQRKKEFWATNVLRQWFISRQTRPAASFLRSDWPNADHDLWEIDTKDQRVQFLYTLPTAQDSASIMKNAQQYSPDLINTIKAFNEGKLA